MLRSKLFNNISPTVKFLSLLIIIISILIAKSIYLMLLLTAFCLYICISISYKVNIYVKFIKNIIILLLIFLLAYIIMLSKFNILNIVIFIYKELLICIYIKIFKLVTNEFELHTAISKILKPFRMLDIEKFSFDILNSINLIDLWFESKEKIRDIELFHGKRNYNLKNRFLNRVVYVCNENYKYSLKLKINHYGLRKEKINFKSIIILVIFIIFLILCISKEVFL